MKKILNIKEPDITALEKKEVLNCLKNSQISTYGQLVKKIEKNLKIFSGAKYNLPLNSGSAALLLAFKSSGVNKNDVVITQSFTFGATVHAIQNAQASSWLFDIDKKSLSIDLKQLEENLIKKTYFRNGYTYLKKNRKRVFAICPVTSFGIIPDLLKLKKISKKYNLKIIVDAACALGNKYNKKSLIQYADVVVYSFNGNKSFTSGGGGALSTNNKNLFQKAKILAENGKSKGNYNYTMFGHNYKMTNIHAAILKAQLSRYQEIKKNLLAINKEYKKKIVNPNFVFFNHKKNSNNILWLNFVLCNSKFISNKLIKYLRNKKIYSNYFWKPMHLQPIKKYLMFEKMNYTEQFFDRVVLIPSSSFLKKKDIGFVIKILNNFK